MAHSSSGRDSDLRDTPVAAADQLGLLFPVESPRETRRIWNVSALVAEIRSQVERSYPECWVEGEISNLRAAPSGHLYFTLKDDEGQIPVVLFRRQASLLRFRPDAGLHVLVRGRVSIYEERGQLQLIAETLEPAGAGALQLAFEQLKERLQREGLFDTDRKRALPAYPKCIGIITSPAGAVIRDFLNIAARRHAALDVLLYPASVQGPQAAAEIASGLLYFNQMHNVDAVVIARGGGSAEDLAAFNTEVLARAIAASTLPVVSAVGHETDFTIGDLVADLRAPTPSAAAELLTAMQHGVAERVDSLTLRLLRACRYAIALAGRHLAAVSPEATIARMRGRLDRAQQRADEQQFRLIAGQHALLRRRTGDLQRLHARLLEHSSFATLALRRERQSIATHRLQRSLERRLLAAHRRTDALSNALLLRSPAHRGDRLRQSIEHLRERNRLAIAARIDRARASVAGVAGRLAALSPIAVLDRGYSMTWMADGRLLRDSNEAAAGDILKTRLARGSLVSTVTHTEGRR